MNIQQGYLCLEYGQKMEKSDVDCDNKLKIAYFVYVFIREYGNNYADANP